MGAFVHGHGNIQHYYLANPCMEENCLMTFELSVMSISSVILRLMHCAGTARCICWLSPVDTAAMPSIVPPVFSRTNAARWFTAFAPVT